jgi:hypothetical protein
MTTAQVSSILSRHAREKSRRVCVKLSLTFSNSRVRQLITSEIEAFAISERIVELIV